MRIYQMPIQLEREEKLFGGSISLRKMIYLVVCGGFGALCFLALYRFSVYGASLVWGLFLVCGWFLAFHKVRKEYDVDAYAVMLARFFLLPKARPFYGGEKN